MLDKGKTPYYKNPHRYNTHRKSEDGKNKTIRISTPSPRCVRGVEDINK